MVDADLERRDAAGCDGLRGRPGGDVEAIAGVGRPKEGRGRACRDGVGSGLPVPVQAEGTRVRGAVEDQNRDRAVGVLEGDILKAAVAVAIGLDAVRAGLHVFGEMAEHVILDIARNRGRGGAGVDRDDAAAIAAAMLHGGAAVLVQRHIPEDDRLAPVADDIDDLVFKVVCQIVGEDGSICAAGALGEVDRDRAREVVHGVLRVGGIAGVAVEGDAGQVAAHGGVVRKHLAITREIPVMLVAENAWGDVGPFRTLADGGFLFVRLQRRERGPEIAGDEAALVYGIDKHGRVAVVLVQRLVLRGDVVDGNAIGLVSLDEFGEVSGESSVVRRVERAAIQAAIGFHPCRGRPGQGQDLDLRVDGKRGFDGRQDVGLVVRDRELAQLRVGRARCDVVIGVAREGEIGSAHGLAQEGKVDALRAEQVGHDLVALRGGELIPDQVGSGVGKGSPDAVEALVANRVVDRDRQLCARARGEGECGLGCEQLGLVRGGLDHADGLSFRGTRKEGCGSERERFSFQEGSFPRACVASHGGFLCGGKNGN